MKRDYKKILKWFVAPFIFFIFGAYMTANYIINAPGVTVLENDYDSDIFTHAHTSELHAGDSIAGEFEARNNHLGIVLVRFNTFHRINDDSVVFRIREKGQEDWFYENTYKVDQFQPNEQFTFGMPVISDSKGKEYQFEVESTIGEPENAVALSNIEPVVSTRHQYPKELIASSVDEGVKFLVLKTVNLFQNFEFPLFTLLYFLPLLGYFLWLHFFPRYLSDKYYLVLVIPIALFVESFFLRNTYDIGVLIITVFTLFIFLAYKLSSRVAFLFALIFLILTPIFLEFGNELVAENFAMWAYLLLVIGTVQALIELKRGDKGLVDYDEFLQKALPFYPQKKKKKKR